MKVFVTISSFTVLAIALLVLADISPSNAQSGICPAISTSTANCRNGGMLGPILLPVCLTDCDICYADRQLQSPSGCLVQGKCQCLEQENGASTTQPPTEDPTAQPSTPEQGTTDNQQGST